MVIDLFKEYEPIDSIYETAEEYVAFPKAVGEPLAIFYDKNLKQYNVMFFYQDKDNSISDVVENGTLVYGKELDFSDEF